MTTHLSPRSPSDGTTAPNDLGHVLRGMARRWWWILGFPVVVALLSIATHRPPDRVIQARLTFAIDVPASALLEGSDEGSAAKVGEALIDDMARIIPGQAFADAVAARLPADASVTSGEIAGSLSADDRHRVSDVTVTRTVPGTASPAAVRATRAELEQVATAVVAELRESGGQWFARLGADDVRLTIVDGPTVSTVPPTLRTRLEIPLRVVLALAVALTLTAALSATDRRIYDGSSAATVAGAPLMAAIPTHERRSPIQRILTR